jgi:Mg-chelatase subunit ChlD
MNIEVSEINVNNNIIKGLKIIGNSVSTRKSTHTIVLLDNSGSMQSDNKLKNVKKSLTFLLKFLQKSDQISLVTFNSVSEILIENMNVTSKYTEAITHTIDTLEACGGTNLSAGLLNVKALIERSVLVNQHISKTGLIILTDGHTNEGMIGPSQLISLCESIKNVLPSLSITTIGYNDDHNSLLLRDIATTGGGSYNIVNNIEEVATVFGTILGGLMTTVVQNITVTYPSSWNCLNMYAKNTYDIKTVLFIGDICAESEIILLFDKSDMNSVNVFGLDTNTYASIDMNVVWSSINISVNTEPYYISYSSNIIANILQNIRRMNKDEITSLLKPIKEYIRQPTIHHPLVPILKQEILSIESQIYDNIYISQNQNIQSCAFLTLGRGVSARTPQRRGSYDITDYMSNLNISTPFSNRIQREITSHMSQHVSGDPHDIESDSEM